MVSLARNIFLSIVIVFALTAFAVAEEKIYDPPQEVGKLRAAAEKGSWEAQYNLGQCYHYGRGVPKDDAEAIKWWRKAAEQGSASAQNNLSMALYNGDGVQKNEVEALKWAQKAAEGNNTRAQWGLCGTYYFGRGVEKNKVTADMWCQLAVKNKPPFFFDGFIKWLLELTMPSAKVAEATRRVTEWKPALGAK